MLETALPVSFAHIDANSALASADDRFAELNRMAGGEIGRPIAVPEIASLVRLSARLGIVIARRLVVADGDGDVELSVRVEPDAEGVRIEASGWRERVDWDRGISDSRERDLLRSDADWLWETDASLHITALSDEAALDHGIETDTLLGQPLTRLFSLSDDDEAGFPILSALASHGRFDGQSAFLRPTGEPVRLAANPRTDPIGRFAGFTGAVRMVPQLAAAAEERHSEQADSEAPSAFGGRLERALRGPLDRIIANADSIRAQTDGPLRQDYANYAADIADAGRHLMALVEDLVDLQAIERDDFDVSREPIDLADIARRAAGLLNLRAQEAEIVIDRPKRDEALAATGEFRRALQILVNLIGNAVRYSPPGGMIWICVERDDERACVIVADQGKGIAEEDQARIFEKFERVDPKEAGGSGLGLYIARRLARAMGGDITVDSAPGQGARFVLALPARDEG